MNKAILRVAAATILIAPLAAQSSAARVHYRPLVTLQLPVSDLDRAIKFYVDVLEYRITERRDDLGFAHVATNVPGLELGLSAGGTLTGTGGAIVNISVADVAAARALLESRGVKFSGETRVIPGKVALAGFSDPDGNKLRFAGPPPR